MAPICPVSAARSVSVRMRNLSWTVKVRQRGRAEISGDTATGDGTIVGRRPTIVPSPVAVSGWVRGMGMTERSYASSRVNSRGVAVSLSLARRGTRYKQTRGRHLLRNVAAGARGGRPKGFLGLAHEEQHC